MYYTDNYQLPQWEGQDRILRTDFNGMVDTIDQSCGNCRIQMGSYRGTGKSGEANPCVLTFDFQPKILLMDVLTPFSDGGHIIWFYGMSSVSHPSDLNSRFNISWQGKMVRWYQRSTSSSGPNYQLNKLGQEYTYIAIG